MSVSGLGSEAKCGKLHASDLVVPYLSGGVAPKTLTNANDGETIADPKGLYLVDANGGNTSITFGNGSKSGDIAEVLYVRSGGNTFDLGITVHIGGAKTASFGTVSGGYLKCVWVSGISGVGNGWYVLARSASTDATATSVSNLPALA